jgi:hypothetical protein
LLKTAIERSGGDLRREITLHVVGERENVRRIDALRRRGE